MLRKNPLHDKEKSDLSGTTLNTLVKALGDIKKVTIFMIKILTSIVKISLIHPQFIAIRTSGVYKMFL